MWTPFGETRLNRQRRLSDSEPLDLHVLIDGAVVRRVVGGPQTMLEQLAHLLDMTERQNITVQVLPFSSGAYGPMAGPCTIVNYGNRRTRQACT